MRTHFWWDREKHSFMSPDGRIFGSRKAILKEMEKDGKYTMEDFLKVKKGLKRKGKRKPANSWLPGKRQKTRQKKIKIVKSVELDSWCIDASDNVEDELDAVTEAHVLKEIEEDEIMNDAEEDEILQQEKKIRDVNEEFDKLEEREKIRPCFVKIFRLEEVKADSNDVSQKVD
jgi:hypothetical protein